MRPNERRLALWRRPSASGAMSALAAFFRDITLGQARAVLFGTWLFGAFAVCLFFALRSLQAHYAGAMAAAWEWLVPTMGPTLAIISASAVVNAFDRDPAEDRKLARPIVFYVTLAWSILYLGALIAMIWASANTPWDNVYVRAATPIAAMQIVLAGLLGVFLAAKARHAS